MQRRAIQIFQFFLYLILQCIRVFAFVLTYSRVRKLNAFPKLPKDDRVIVVCNHHSLFDPPLLATVFPFRRPYVPMRFVGKADFFRNPTTAFLLRYVSGTIPAIRGGNRSLAALTEQWVTVSKNGHGLTIFPEGRMTADELIGELKPGAAYVAMRVGAWVIPVALAGNLKQKKKFGRRYVFAVGNPIWVEQTNDCQIPGRVIIQAEVFREAMIAQQKRLTNNGFSH